MAGTFEQIKQSITEGLTAWNFMSGDEQRGLLNQGLQEVKKYSGLFNLNVITKLLTTAVTGDTSKSEFDLDKISKVMEDAKISPEIAVGTKKQLLEFQEFIKGSNNQLLQTSANLLIAQLNKMLINYENYSPDTQQAMQNVIRACGEMAKKGEITDEDVNKLINQFNVLANSPEEEAYLLSRLIVGLVIAVSAISLFSAAVLLSPLIAITALVVSKVLEEPEMTLGATSGVSGSTSEKNEGTASSTEEKETTSTKEEASGFTPTSGVYKRLLEAGKKNALEMQTLNKAPAAPASPPSEVPESDTPQLGG